MPIKRVKPNWNAIVRSDVLRAIAHKDVKAAEQHLKDFGDKINGTTRNYLRLRIKAAKNGE